MTLIGNEVINIVGVDGAGHPAGVPNTISVTNLTNFEGSGVLAASVSATSNITLAAITGLPSFNLFAGGSYIFDLYISVTNNASGGLKLAFGGTATASVFSADTWAYNTTTLAAQGVITSLASSLVAYTGSVTTLNITGSINCLASGTFFLQFAQNASFATATTINAGSNMWLDRLA